MENLILRKSELCAFDDESHVESFVKYLTRTDTRQRWTNEDTENNFYAVRKDDGKFSVFGGRDFSGIRKRREIFDAISSALEFENINSLGNDIIQVYDCRGDDEDEFDVKNIIPLSPDDCEKVFNDILKETQDDSDVLVLVMHNDQKYDGPVIDHHIHRVISV